jgi:hypothetical protein
MNHDPKLKFASNDSKSVYIYTMYIIQCILYNVFPSSVCDCNVNSGFHTRLLEFLFYYDFQGIPIAAEASGSRGPSPNTLILASPAATMATTASPIDAMSRSGLQRAQSSPVRVPALRSPAGEDHNGEGGDNSPGENGENEDGDNEVGNGGEQSWILNVKFCAESHRNYMVRRVEESMTERA